jgi:hypothetical protein
MVSSSHPILVGNSFPWALVERPIRAIPASQVDLQTACLSATGVHSFWGHPSTLQAASAFAGLDLTPRSARPALVLSPENLPTLDGHSFDEVWLISPRYHSPSFRPRENSPVGPEEIARWQVLRITWEP